MKIGEKIKATRVKQGMTQSDLAKELHVTPAMVSQYETGFRVPKSDTLDKISSALGVTTSRLLSEGEAWPEGGGMYFFGKDGEVYRHNTEKWSEVIGKAYEQQGKEQEIIQDLLKVTGLLTNEGKKKVVGYALDISKNPEYLKEQPPQRPSASEDNEIIRQQK